MAPRRTSSGGAASGTRRTLAGLRGMLRGVLREGRGRRRRGPPLASSGTFCPPERRHHEPREAFAAVTRTVVQHQQPPPPQPPRLRRLLRRAAKTSPPVFGALRGESRPRRPPLPPRRDARQRLQLSTHPHPVPTPPPPPPPPCPPIVSPPRPTGRHRHRSLRSTPRRRLSPARPLQPVSAEQAAHGNGRPLGGSMAHRHL